MALQLYGTVIFANLKWHVGSLINWTEYLYIFQYKTVEKPLASYTIEVISYII